MIRAIFLISLLWTYMFPAQYISPGFTPPGASGITGTFHNAGACVSGGSGCSYSPGVTAGDIIVCAPSTDTPSATVSCNSTGLTFTSCSGPSTNGGETTEAFWTLATTTTSITLNAVASSNLDYMSSAFMIITPSSVPTLDVTDNSSPGAFTSTTAAITGTTPSTALTNEIAISVFGIKNASGTANWTAGSGWSNMTSASSGISGHSDSATEWKNTSTVGTVQGTATISANNSGVGLVCVWK